MHDPSHRLLLSLALLLDDKLLCSCVSVEKANLVLGTCEGFPLKKTCEG
jgi:hypothetical protein